MGLDDHDRPLCGLLVARGKGYVLKFVCGLEVCPYVEYVLCGIVRPCTCTSRNTASVLLSSCVNLIVGCTRLNLSSSRSSA